MPYQGLILDFDGTLADTVGTHTTARLEAFDQLGYQVDMAIHEEGHRHGSHPSEIIGWILKQAGFVAQDADVLLDPVVQEVVALKGEIYKGHAANGLDAIDGSPEFVNWAVKQYGPENLAIATTASRLHEVIPFLKRYNLEDAFSLVVGKEDTPVGRSKPDSFVYDEALRLLDINPLLLIAVEDTPFGIASAQGAGMPVIGITTTHSAEDLKMATHITNSFRTLPGFLAMDSQQIP